MAVIEGGASGTLAEVGQVASSPQHATLRPTAPSSSLGAYCIAATSGTLAAALAALAQVFYVRWTDATRFMVVHRVKLSFQPLTLFTAGTGIIQVQMAWSEVTAF